MILAEALVAVIGWSHLLQVPITLGMKRRLFGVVSPFAGLPVLTKRISDIMALASLYVPTLVGLVIAQAPAAALRSSPIRTLAVAIAVGLWCPRLLAQLLYVGPVFPRDARRWHWLLVAIFGVQGPIFVGVLLGGGTSRTP